MQYLAVPAFQHEAACLQTSSVFSVFVNLFSFLFPMLCQCSFKLAPHWCCCKPVSSLHDWPAQVWGYSGGMLQQSCTTLSAARYTHSLVHRKKICDSAEHIFRLMSHCQLLVSLLWHHVYVFVLRLACWLCTVDAAVKYIFIQMHSKTS